MTMSSYDEKPRAFTVAEMQEFFLAHLQMMVHYWARIPINEKDEAEKKLVADRGEVRYRLEGLLHSFLVTLDGCTALPAFDLIPSPHPEDKAYHLENGENWWESIVINEAMLHDSLYASGGPKIDTGEGPYQALFNSTPDGIGDPLWIVRGPHARISIRTNDAAIANRIALLLNLSEKR